MALNRPACVPQRSALQRRRPASPLVSRSEKRSGATGATGTYALRSACLVTRGQGGVWVRTPGLLTGAVFSSHVTKPLCGRGCSRGSWWVLPPFFHLPDGRPLTDSGLGCRTAVAARRVTELTAETREAPPAACSPPAALLEDADEAWSPHLSLPDGGRGTSCRDIRAQLPRSCPASWVTEPRAHSPRLQPLPVERSVIEQPELTFPKPSTSSLLKWGQ